MIRTRKTAWVLAGISLSVLLLAPLLLASSGALGHSFSRSFHAPGMFDTSFGADNAIRIFGIVILLPGSSSGGGGIGTAGQVPVGSRMVVEFVGASCQADFAPGVDVMTIDLQTPDVSSNTFDTYKFVPTKAPVAPSSTAGSSVNWYILAQPLRLYSDGTTASPLSVGVGATAAVPNINARSKILCTFEISGYLVAPGA
ncbi:MAG: hypothetical protein WCD34_18440 [Candidatus Acidiferrum sp.]|jgi:hypothetical protein